MRSINIIILVFTISSSRGQLNYEGNPLTENTEYTAEESHYSKRNDPRLSAKFNEHNVKVVDSYVAAANSLMQDGQTKKPLPNPPSSSSSSSFDMMPRNTQLKQTNEHIDVNRITNTGSLSHQVPSITIFDRTTSGQIQGNAHTSNQPRDNTNEIQITAQRQSASLPSSNEALSYFLKSQTPEESRLALDNYLNLQNNQNNRAPTNINLIDNNQNYLSTHDINRQSQTDSSSNVQSTGAKLIPNSYPFDQQIYQIQPLAPAQSAVWHQIPIQNRRDFISTSPRHRRPIYHYYGPGGRILRGKQRFQTRVGHGHYQSVNPPTSFIGGVGKPPGEIIYTRPPGINGPPGPLTAISNSRVPYEDASAHFPESNHPPVPKDVYYSQLYSQSYDPYYYDYIAKTGKIKPWLYGKLGPKEDSSFWHELYLSFKDHGMKNMLNPMFLLGLSIPAVTLMLSAMVGSRSFDGRSMRNFNSNQTDWNWSIKDLDKFQKNVLTAIQCVNERRAKGEDPAGCAGR